MSSLSRISRHSVSKTSQLPPIEEVPNIIRARPGNLAKPKTKAMSAIHSLVQDGKHIRESEGLCDDHYNRIKDGTIHFIFLTSITTHSLYYTTTQHHTYIQIYSFKPLCITVGILDLKWIINERQQLPSEKVLSREITDNLDFKTYKRFSARVDKRKGFFGTRRKNSSSQEKVTGSDGDVICSTEMFKGTCMVYATDRNLLIGYDFLNEKQYSKEVKDSFVTCLEFYEHEGILLAGHSNNVINFIDPRNYKFKILKTFYDLTAFPPVQIKVLQKLSKLVMVNSANEVILCERTSSKTVKFKSRGIIRAKPDDPMFEVEVLEFPLSRGVIVALVSELKTRLIWVSMDEAFKVKFLEKFKRFDEDGGNPESEQPLSEQQSFTFEDFSINTRKSSFSFDFFGENKRANEMSRRQKLNIPNLIMLLKKKAKPSYGRSSIFLMSKKLWRSTGEKFFSVLIFGRQCEVSYSIVAPDGMVMKILSRRFELKDNVIYASVLGVEMVLILFETLEFCFLHLDQFRKQEDQRNSSKVGMLKKGSISKDSFHNSGAETNDSENNEEKPKIVTGKKNNFCFF